MEVQTHPYEVPEGTVYAVILPADRKPSGPRGMEEVFPMVEITTDLAAPSGTPRHEWPKGYLTIRARKYNVWTHHKRLPENAGYVYQDGTPRPWDKARSPYDGGHRNTNGLQIDSTCKAADRLREITTEVLQRFETDNPDWARESIKLGFLVERARYQTEADRVRSQLAHFEAEVERVNRQLKAF